MGKPNLNLRKDNEPSEAANQLKFAVDAFVEQECEVIGAILNRVEPEKESEFKSALKKKLGGTGEKKELTVIPDNEFLASPSVIEIAAQLDAEILFGAEHTYKNIVQRFSVAGMTLSNYLDFITENCAVVASADRGEVILGTLQAQLSDNYQATPNRVILNQDKV